MDYDKLFDKFNKFSNLRELSFQLKREGFKKVFTAASRLNFVENLSIYYDGRNHEKNKNILSLPTSNNFNIFPESMNNIKKVTLFLNCPSDDPYSVARFNQDSSIRTFYTIEIYEV